MAPSNHDVAAVGEEAAWGAEEGAGDNGWMNGEARAREREEEWGRSEGGEEAVATQRVDQAGLGKREGWKVRSRQGQGP